MLVIVRFIKYSIKSDTAAKKFELGLWLIIHVMTYTSNSFSIRLRDYYNSIAVLHKSWHVLITIPKFNVSLFRAFLDIILHLHLNALKNWGLFFCILHLHSVYGDIEWGVIAEQPMFELITCSLWSECACTNPWSCMDVLGYTVVWSRVNGLVV